MKKIEIIPWVKFNEPGIKDEIEAVVKECKTKMDFVRKIRDSYELSVSDANIVADKFFKTKV